MTWVPAWTLNGEERIKVWIAGANKGCATTVGAKQMLPLSIQTTVGPLTAIDHHSGKVCVQRLVAGDRESHKIIIGSPLWCEVNVIANIGHKVDGCLGCYVDVSCSVDDCFCAGAAALILKTWNIHPWALDVHSTWDIWAASANESYSAALGAKP